MSTYHIAGDHIVASGDHSTGKVVNQGRSGGGEDPARPGQLTVLFLAASPQDLTPVRQDMEFKRIRQECLLSPFREAFRLEYEEAAQLGDIQRSLIQHRPGVVHFSGHGDSEGRIYVEDEMGFSKPTNVEGVAGLFAQYRETVRCVVVNACYSDRLAGIVSRDIGYAIGMNSEVGNTASTLFSVSFYRSIFGGDDVPAAFDAARCLVHADEGATGEYRTPVLYYRGRRSG